MHIEHKQEIQELIKDCPPGCKCHPRGIQDFCKARDIGMESFVECLEEEPFDCSYGHSMFCSFPLVSTSVKT
jgi:hypothetical protein